MKAFTDILQSKKLAEILPLESADIVWVYSAFEDDYFPHFLGFRKIVVGGKDIKAWSLAALLDILPTGKVLLHDKGNHGYKCICNNIDSYYFNNPVDACYEMIIKLNEQKLL